MAFQPSSPGTRGTWPGSSRLSGWAHLRNFCRGADVPGSPRQRVASWKHETRAGSGEADRTVGVVKIKAARVIDGDISIRTRHTSKIVSVPVRTQAAFSRADSTLKRIKGSLPQRLESPFRPPSRGVWMGKPYEQRLEVLRDAGLGPAIASAVGTSLGDQPGVRECQQHATQDDLSCRSKQSSVASS